MPSFDVVSKVDWAEFGNALLQAQKEVAQRFDFRGTDTSIERTEAGVLIEANSDERAKAALAVLEEKLIRRKVSLKHLDRKDPTRGPKGSSRLAVDVKEGIETEKAKELVKLLKNSKLKVQGSIQEDSVRVSGKKKDDLQAAIEFLRNNTESLELDLRFNNFRD
jgi:uncharacterized protein YajQ (UPF0234 family)